MKRSIDEFLAALRREKGLTQREVAERLGVSNKTVSSWERGTVLPDILLLPAIAELYGVTADEILAGERREEPEKAQGGGAEEIKPEPKLSEKSETKLLKRRLAKFTTQVYILAGIFLAGVLLLYFGVWKDLRTVVWSGFAWWILLIFTGLPVAIVSFAVMIALFRGAVNSADEEAESYPKYAILLYRKASLFCYFAAGEAFLCAFFTACSFLAGTNFTDEFLFLLTVCVILCAAFFLVGFFLYGYALNRWDKEEAAKNRKKNKKLYLKTLLFGAIPLILAVVLMALLSSLTFETRDLLYSANRESFKKYMETIQMDEAGERKEYYLPLSELEKGLGTEIEYGMEYQYGNNLIYCFIADGFCTVQLWEGEYEGFVLEVERLTAEDGFSVYNLCEGVMGSVMIGGNTVLDMHYEIRTEGDTAFYERVFLESFREAGNLFGGLAIFVDLAVCFAVCALKREKTKVFL